MTTAKTAPVRSEVLRSATRTLSALDALSRHPDGATAKSLSSDLGLHLSTTYHLLNTLVAAGYAVQDPISRHFRLGCRIPHLQQAFLAALQPSPGVLTFLHLLQETTGETVYLGRLHGQEVVVVGFTTGTRADAVPAGYVGLSGPAHATAIGHAILASLPPLHLERFLAAADLSARYPFPGSDPAWLRQELGRIRERGYAVDRGDRANSPVGCLAAAVGRADQPIPDALSVVAPRARFLEEESQLAARVTTIAQAATALAKTIGSAQRPTLEEDASSALARAMVALRPPRLTDATL